MSFWYFQFFQKTKKIDQTTMGPQVELFLFIFWKNSRHQTDIDLYQNRKYLMKS